MKMENRFANILSYVAHPLLIPMFGLLVISNSGTYAADLDKQFMQFIYLSTFILTLLLPGILIPLFFYSGLARNITFFRTSGTVNTLVYYPCILYCGLFSYQKVTN